MSLFAFLADPDAEADAAPDDDSLRLAASGTRVGATAGLIAPVVRRPAARLRAHRLEGAVLAVVAAWAIAGGLTAIGWL